ncbi:PAS domain S-box protein [soil metagenome]
METSSDALLAAIVDSSDDAIVSKDLTSRITSWNAGAERIFGYTADEMIGRSIMLLIPQDMQYEEQHILSRLRNGEKIEHFETIRRHKDGKLIHVSLTVSPLRDDHGVIVGASKIARDITPSREAEEAHRLLMREVNHRSKNLLAIIQALIRQTSFNVPTEVFVQRTSERLQALSLCQDLLVESEWRGVNLRDLARSQFQFLGDKAKGRIVLDGDAITLSPNAAQAFSMAFHELAANASRYGALSGIAGNVHIRWSLDKNWVPPLFSFCWLESGGPTVVPDQAKGFGVRVLQRVAPESLEGTAKLNMDAAGLTWTLEAPAGGILVNAVAFGA